MMRRDLEKAKVPIRNEHGVADFHALRTTFASLLNAAGVPLVTAQQLMRHSVPKLTSVFYTRTTVVQRADAVALIPMIVPPATGDGTKKIRDVEAAGKKGENNVDFSEPPPSIVDDEKSPLKLVDTPVDTNKTEMDGKRRMLTEWAELEKAAGAESMVYEKSPENGAFLHFAYISGPGIIWGEKPDSNRRPSEPQSTS